MKYEKDLARYLPPGLDVKQELGWYLGGGALALLYSFGFLFRYGNRRAALFYSEGFKKILRPNAIMPDFKEMLGGSLAGFYILALASLLLVGYHYSYFFQGSKSIYLMRRLPERSELLKRSWALPLFGAIVALLAALMILLFYYGIYMICTPEACLRPGQWQKLWTLFAEVTK